MGHKGGHDADAWSCKAASDDESRLSARHPSHCENKKYIRIPIINISVGIDVYR